MDPVTSRENLNLFVNNLPDDAFFAIRDKDVDPSLLTTAIASEHEFAIRETGNICEGVLRILKGEDSPSNLVSFIQKDPNIEEDNRPQIPELAYEIQERVFDPVLPILKQAGFPIKEGRVPQPPPAPLVTVPNSLSDSSFPKGGARFGEGGGFQSGQNPSARENVPLPLENPPKAAPFMKGGMGESTTPLPSLEERHMRALLRIAAGTVYTEGQLRESFQTLAPGLRQAISSVDTANAIQEIAKKYLLHVDQMAALAGETGLVLLGLTHPADFIGNLGKRLRLPEEKARDIARDVSAQILSKVRDALRGLHEESTKSEIRNPKQIPSTNIQNQANQTELLKQVNVMPRQELTTNYQLPTTKTPSTPLPRTTTPYSAGAKWNTGDNILKRQADEKEEALTRAEVLRGIENPGGIKSEARLPAPAGVIDAGGQAGSSPAYAGRKLEEGQLKTPNLPARRSLGAGEQLKTSPVGPTGWKPPAGDGRNVEARSSKRDFSLKAQPARMPEDRVQAGGRYPSSRAGLAMGHSPRNAPSGEKTRPSETAVNPPESKPDTLPQDFLDEKLQASVSLPRDEKRYTTDPYREPLE